MGVTPAVAMFDGCQSTAADFLHDLGPEHEPKKSWLDATNQSIIGDRNQQ